MEKPKKKINVLGIDFNEDEVKITKTVVTEVKNKQYKIKTDGKDYWKKEEYDDKGRVIKEEHSNGYFREYKRDDKGRVIERTRKNDGKLEKDIIKFYDEKGIAYVEEYCDDVLYKKRMHILCSDGDIWYESFITNNSDHWETVYNIFFPKEEKKMIKFAGIELEEGTFTKEESPFNTNNFFLKNLKGQIIYDSRVDKDGCEYDWYRKEYDEEGREIFHVDAYNNSRKTLYSFDGKFKVVTNNLDSTLRIERV